MDTQDVSTEVLFKLWPWLEANKNRLIAGGAALVVVAIIYSFISWQHGQNEINAGEAFTQLVSSNPSGLSPSAEASAFLEMASKYAGTEAAQRARLQAASILFESGNYADAQVQFQSFADSHNGPLAAIATLGEAASLEAQGKLDQAAVAYQKIASGHGNSAAYFQAEFSLGRLAEKSGNLADAESHYEAAAQAGRAGGSISEEAQGRAYEIKLKLSAAQKPTQPTQSAQTIPSFLSK
jgi:predicted negative regulator of RcsB-dependent stress response